MSSTNQLLEGLKRNPSFEKRWNNICREDDKVNGLVDIISQLFHSSFGMVISILLSIGIGFSIYFFIRSIKSRRSNTNNLK
jgi:hypothetical protein